MAISDQRGAGVGANFDKGRKVWSSLKVVGNEKYGGSRI